MIAGSLAASPAFASSVESSPPQPGSATATLAGCAAAVDEADRSATFAGQMVATATSAQLQMRIDLLERTSSATDFVAVSGAGLGVWQSSTAGVKIYRYVRQVTNLAAPASYRAAISYRWLNRRQRIVRQAKRLTPICAQPDERPLLVVARIAIAPSPSSLDAQYSVTLHNSGRGPAGPFDLELTVNGTPVPAIIVQSLAAGTRAVRSIVAPRCTLGSPVVVAIDPQGAIQEAPGGGQSKTVACPLAAAARR